MSEICVFAGTTEGRRLLEFLAGQDVSVLACVATDYGLELSPRGDNIEIAAGRLDAAAMTALFASRRFDMVIDATHPYAEAVSTHIAAACEATGTPRLRLNRGEAAADADAVYVDSIEAAADFLAAHPGRALLATGGKSLAPYTRVPDYRERLYARVLPMAESLQACADAGFAPSHVIAMQGPFSAEMNAATLKAIRADWLVTKDSGDSGGFMEKLAGAKAAGARCVVVGRPKQTEGIGFAQAVAELISRFGLKDVRDVAVVGIGPGAAQGLTAEAERALWACDCVIGAPRMLEAAARFGKPAFDEYAPDKIKACIAAHPEYRRVAVLMSGDPGFFSGAKKLLPRLAGHKVRVIPGVSSLQALCARLQTPWEDVRAVSLHGREGTVVPELRRHGRVFALLDGADAIRRLCEELCTADMGGARLTVGERLSYPDERVTRGTAQSLRDMACAPLSAVLIEADKQPLPVGLPDEAFERQLGEGGATVPMTKSEARAVTLSKLRLPADAVMYDIGAGTGSVGIEAALLCPQGRVFAIERRADAVELIKRNAARFGVGNLAAVEGEAPTALDGLPAPTHAFIGGSGGGLNAIVRALLDKNPRVRIVVNAATPETVGEITRIITDFGFEDAEIVQLGVARGRRAGKYHLMDGLNPVWIAAMQRGEADEG